VIVPSLPGYTYSFTPGQKRASIVDCADGIHRLMIALGHERYAIAHLRDLVIALRGAALHLEGFALDVEHRQRPVAEIRRVFLVQISDRAACRNERARQIQHYGLRHRIVGDVGEQLEQFGI